MGVKEKGEKDTFRDIGLCYIMMDSQAQSQVPAGSTLNKVLHLAEPQHQHL